MLITDNYQLQQFVFLTGLENFDGFVKAEKVIFGLHYF